MSEESRRLEKYKVNISVPQSTEKQFKEYVKTLKKRVLEQHDIRDNCVWKLTHDNSVSTKSKVINGIYYDVVTYFFDIIEADLTFDSGIEVESLGDNLHINGDSLAKRKELLERKEYLLEELEKVENKLKELGMSDEKD